MKSWTWTQLRPWYFFFIFSKSARPVWCTTEIRLWSSGCFKIKSDNFWFKNIELGNDGYSIVTKCIVFLILPGILYQIINSEERFKTGESTPWSQIVGEIGFIPEGTVRRYTIGPVFDNSYWGEVKCQKLNADTKCIVTNKNGVQLDYIFK